MYRIGRRNLRRLHPLRTRTQWAIPSIRWAIPSRPESCWHQFQLQLQQRYLRNNGAVFEAGTSQAEPYPGLHLQPTQTERDDRERWFDNVRISCFYCFIVKRTDENSYHLSYRKIESNEISFVHFTVWIVRIISASTQGIKSHFPRKSKIARHS